MKRSEVVWSQSTSPVAQPSLNAKLTDKDGLEWEATIKHEPYGAMVNRLTVTLMCCSAGRMHSNSAIKSITEGQEWCYQTLGIE
jgi:hypothetical protein